MTRRNRSLLSTFFPDGTVELHIEETDVRDPAGDEVLIEIEASPVNPSDIVYMLGPIDIDSLQRDGDGPAARLKGRFGGAALAPPSLRLGVPLTCGNEGVGTVIAAGPEAQPLIGQRVAIMGGPWYARYRTASAKACVPLPPGTPPEAAASLFVNPMTALSMVETMRLEGHKALVHTAAASSLGQMLTKICVTDGVGLVNIVRRQDQVALLRDLGARHVLNSEDPDFEEQLVDAIAETDATLAFDAIGSGALVSSILAAMEKVAVSKMTEYQPYGSDRFKQAYIYGDLGAGPTMLARDFGLAWSVSGYLVVPALAKIGPEGVQRMQQRIASELGTTFASSYSGTIGLDDLLDPEKMRTIARLSTGQKYLVDPRR